MSHPSYYYGYAGRGRDDSALVSTRRHLLLEVLVFAFLLSTSSAVTDSYTGPPRQQGAVTTPISAALNIHEAFDESALRQLLHARTSASTPSSLPAGIQHARYLIVGAGPAGLQLGHYLDSAGRDYVILDASNSTVGSFFQRYPRFRQLISVNKPRTGSSHFDYMMRYDWNSLLLDPSHSGAARSSLDVPGWSRGNGTRRKFSSNSSSTYINADRIPFSSNSSSTYINADRIPHGLLMRHLSNDYYPHADTVVQLMANVAAHEGLRVQLGTLVQLIDYLDGGSGGDDDDQGLAAGMHPDARYIVRSAVTVTRNVTDSSGITRSETTTSLQSWTCKYLVLATGQRKISMPPGKGYHLAEPYATLSSNASHYRDQRVLIIGRGNAGMEVAHHIQTEAAQVVVTGPTRRLKLSWESHYPGDVRQVHNRLLESYQLKVLDQYIEADFDSLRLVRDPHNSSLIWALDAAAERELLSTPPGHRCVSCEYRLFRRPFDRVLLCPGWRFDTDIFTPRMRDRVPMASSVGAPLQASSSGNGGGSGGGGPGGSVKYPALTAMYEGVASPGLFVIGTAAHSRDWKKTSGGFIHGFRYVARAVHRWLEEQERQEQQLLHPAWNAAVAADGDAPSIGAAVSSLPLSSPMAKGWPRSYLASTRHISAAVLNRANRAGGTFQMFGTLADVYLLGSGDRCGATDDDNDGGDTLEEEEEETGRGAAGDVDVDGNLHSIGDQSVLRDTPSLAPGAPATNKTRLCGWLFEEVPIAAVPSLAHRWSKELDLPFTAYLASTLEFGANSSYPGVDPFRIGRAKVPSSHPETSNFLHPVLRYHDSRVHVPHEHLQLDSDAQQARLMQGKQRTSTPNASSTSNLTQTAMGVIEWTRIVPLNHSAASIEARAAAASASGPRPNGHITPVTTLHIIEDFSNVFDIPAKHAAPLLRFLEHIGLGSAMLTERLARQGTAVRMAGRSGYVVLRDVVAAMEDAEDQASSDGGAIEAITKLIADAKRAAVASTTAAQPAVPPSIKRNNVTSTSLDWLRNIQGRLPSYPVGVLLTDSAMDTAVPMRVLRAALVDVYLSAAMASPAAALARHALAAAGADKGVDAKSVVWHPEVVAAVLAEHASRRQVFTAHEHTVPMTRSAVAAAPGADGRSASSNAAAAGGLLIPHVIVSSSLMLEGAPVTMYKADVEMRPYWGYLTPAASPVAGPSQQQHKEGVSQPAPSHMPPVVVHAVPAGPHWHEALPAPVRNSVLYHGPGTRLAVVMVHAAASAPATTTQEAGKQEVEMEEDRVEGDEHDLQRSDRNQHRQRTATKPAVIASSMRSFALRYPAIPIFEIDTTDRLAHGMGPAIAHHVSASIGVEQADVPCLVVVTDDAVRHSGGGEEGDGSVAPAGFDTEEAEARGITDDRIGSRRFKWPINGVLHTGPDGRSAAISGLVEVEIIHLAHMSHDQADAALHQAVMAAARRANVSVTG